MFIVFYSFTPCPPSLVRKFEYIFGWEIGNVPDILALFHAFLNIFENILFNPRAFLENLRFT